MIPVLLPSHISPNTSRYVCHLNAIEFLVVFSPPSLLRLKTLLSLFQIPQAHPILTNASYNIEQQCFFMFDATH